MKKKVPKHYRKNVLFESVAKLCLNTTCKSIKILIFVLLHVQGLMLVHLKHATISI